MKSEAVADCMAPKAGSATREAGLSEVRRGASYARFSTEPLGIDQRRPSMEVPIRAAGTGPARTGIDDWNVRSGAGQRRDPA